MDPFNVLRSEMDLHIKTIIIIYFNIILKKIYFNSKIYIK